MDINELSGWGISQAIAEIVENGFTFDEETGEVFFTSDDLDALNEALDSKLESLAGIYQMYLNKAKSFKDRSKEITDVSKSYDKKAENIKNYMDNLMRANNKTKLEVGDKRLSYRKSMSSEITDEVKLKAYIEADEERKQKYYSYKNPEISKTAIKNDIEKTKQEDGSYTLEIPGFRLVENNNLQIK